MVARLVELSHEVRGGQEHDDVDRAGTTDPGDPRTMYYASSVLTCDTMVSLATSALLLTMLDWGIGRQFRLLLLSFQYLPRARSSVALRHSRFRETC